MDSESQVFPPPKPLLVLLTGRETWGFLQQFLELCFMCVPEGKTQFPTLQTVGEVTTGSPVSSLWASVSMSGGGGGH